MTTLPNTKLIPLTQGKFAIVDEDSYELVSKHKWHAHVRGGIYYARRTINFGRKATTVLMHREILCMVENGFIDHINHDGLDNRKANLRVCSNSLNQANSRKRKGTTSKYKGVCFFKGAGKWQANIKKDDKLHYIGLFKTEDEAAVAYNNMAIQLFGGFAKINEVNTQAIEAARAAGVEGV